MWKLVNVVYLHVTKEVQVIQQVTIQVASDLASFHLHGTSLLNYGSHFMAHISLEEKGVFITKKMKT